MSVIFKLTIGMFENATISGECISRVKTRFTPADSRIEQTILAASGDPIRSILSCREYGKYGSTKTLII